jgi:hypothetical protein
MEIGQWKEGEGKCLDAITFDNVCFCMFSLLFFFCSDLLQLRVIHLAGWSLGSMEYFISYAFLASSLIECKHPEAIEV